MYKLSCKDNQNHKYIYEILFSLILSLNLFEGTQNYFSLKLLLFCQLIDKKVEDRELNKKYNGIVLIKLKHVNVTTIRID